MRPKAELAPELKSVAERLTARVDSPRDGAIAAALVAERAPDERLALAFLLKLAELSPAPVRRALSDRALAGDLVFCLGSSEVIGTGLSAIGDGWLKIFTDARDQTPAALLGAISLDAGRAAIEQGDREAAAKALSNFKRTALVQIAIADLVGKSGVTGTMHLMSRLADECIAGALGIAVRTMPERARAAGDFCVLAMGKLGVNELNLSSDLDLVYLFDSSSPAAQEAGAKLGEYLTELISANCFRIDLRLRPDGKNAPLVTSLAGALAFYQSLGETCERAALLRARPVAGVLELGRRLMSELDRFIYRRYLDFDTLGQLRAMKRQIEQELRTPEAVSRNIKLGYGGIREVEFIVQALTLVYGGRDRRLRSARTIESLERLDSCGYLPRAHELADAYLFLRDVEHKLQVVAGLQTQSLPANAAGVQALAARTGFGKGPEAAAEFQTALGRHRLRVAMAFHEILAGGEERAAPAASADAQAAWSEASDPKAAALSLKAMGFAAPAESAGHLAIFALGSPRSAAPRRRELLERLGPRLLDEISGLADPDLALQNLAAFITAVGARSSFLSLLEQHPATRRVLLTLFASSRYLSTIFIRHPDMLDTLVRSDLARLRRTSGELEAELTALLAACADLESRLDVLRSFRHQEFLRVAIADLAGDLEIEPVQAELTALAETVVRAAMGIARDESAIRTRIPPTLELCAIAMGRLGAAEMSYNSDLDLIFVYNDTAEVAAGGREPAARIVQKLIAVLESRTPEGYAYKLDLRLRPSGNAGPLVASLEGFREYHRQSSAVWERQALVRARVIGGSAALGQEVEAARQEFVFGRGLAPSEVGKIAAMRARMEHEIGVENAHRLNIKQGRGGLVDVEFIAQMMALRHGGRFEELRCRGTVDLVRAIARCGLIAEADARVLEDGYRFLSRLENRLRIESDQPAWALSTEPAELARVARRMGYEGADGAARTLAELKLCRERIRAIFDRCFAAEQRK
jgi:glutamate-ammonia-ligase adenylyltransferase